MKNFFDAIGMASMEKVHSAVIGWMLSDECEALTLSERSELLYTLFGCKEEKEEKKWFETIRAEVEVNNIDILFITNEGKEDQACWVIENKIKSNQHSNQLDKYYNIVTGNVYTDNRGKKRKKETYRDFTPSFCFLTLVKEEPKGDYKKSWRNTLYSTLYDNLKNALDKPTQESSHYFILKEYVECLRELTEALTDFICNPGNYPQAFVDGRTSKGNKNSKDAKGKYAEYIAENNLETIFQECFLLYIMNNEEYFPIEARKNTTIISAGNAMFSTYVRDFPNSNLSLQIEFQAGTYKVVLIHRNYGNPKPNDYKEIYGEYKENKWSKWYPIFEKYKNNNKNWTLEVSNNIRAKEKGNMSGSIIKPRIALDNKIDDDWYKNLAGFKDGYLEAKKIADQIFNEYENACLN